jgi:hypothetical protein
LGDTSCPNQSLIACVTRCWAAFSGACDGMFGQYWRSHAESCVDYRF